MVCALMVVSAAAVASPPSCFTLAASSGTVRITQNRLLADSFSAPVADDFPLLEGTRYLGEVDLVFSDGGFRKVATGMEVIEAGPQYPSFRRKIVILFGGTVMAENLSAVIVCNARPEPLT